jgi:hypothetical protein
MHLTYALLLTVTLLTLVEIGAIVRSRYAPSDPGIPDDLDLDGILKVYNPWGHYAKLRWTRHFMHFGWRFFGIFLWLGIALDRSEITPLAAFLAGCVFTGSIYSTCYEQWGKKWVAARFKDPQDLFISRISFVTDRLGDLCCVALLMCW